MKETTLTLISIILPVVCAILGWIIHRKTERIKIMENQLSDKKYNTYSEIVTMFFNTIKDTKEHKTINQKETMIKIMDAKRDILMYASDDVFKAFNNFLLTSSLMSQQDSDYAVTKSVLQLMRTIRQDMCGKQSSVTEKDILLCLTQNKEDIDKFYPDNV